MALPTPTCQNCRPGRWLHLPAPAAKLLGDGCREKAGQVKFAPGLLLKALRCSRLALGARPQRPCQHLKGKAPASCVPSRTWGMSATLWCTAALAAPTSNHAGGENPSSIFRPRSSCSFVCSGLVYAGLHLLAVHPCLHLCLPSSLSVLLRPWRPSCRFP